MDRGTSFLAAAVILFAVALLVFPVFFFGVLIGIPIGILVSRHPWFGTLFSRAPPAAQAIPMPESETRLERVTITQTRVPIFRKFCGYCGTNFVGPMEITKCANCGASI